ncbi:MAG: hypothetical protein JNM07_08495 [Phycisphaerae bacterium]|nr:hypothetical protein [Phycisphaerae bacterium]
MDAPPQSRRAEWPLLLYLAVAVGVLIVMLALRRVWDVDYWWQLATGEFIAQNGLPAGDVFTYSRAGSVRIETGWAYCVGLRWVVSRLGHEGAVILKAVAVLVTFALAAGTAWLGAPSGGARRGVNAYVAAGVTVVAALSASQRFVARPEIVSCLLLAAFVFLIEHRRRHPTRWILLLPVLQVAWSNTHSLFLLGPAITGLWAGCEILGAGHRRVWDGAWAPGSGRRITEACASAALVGGACLATPYGVEGLRVPVQQLAAVLPGVGIRQLVVMAPLLGVTLGAAWLLMVLLARGWVDRAVGASGAWRGVAIAAALTAPIVALAFIPGVRSAVQALTTRLLPGAASGGAELEKSIITELSSPFTMSQHYTAFFYYKALLVLWAIAVLFASRRQGLFLILLSAAMLLLSVAAVRNLMLFAVVALPIAARGLSPDGSTPATDSIGRAHRRRWWSMAVAALVTGVCLYQARELLTDRYNIRQGDTNQFGVGIARNHFPDGAADFLRAHAIDGNVFCTQFAGSYLAHRGFRVFIDSRAVAGLAEDYTRLMDRPELLLGHCRANNVRAIVLDSAMTSLIDFVARQLRWRLAYADETAAVLLPEGTAPDVARLDLASRGDRWLADLRARLPRPWPFAAATGFSRLSNPHPYVMAASLALTLGAPRAARELYEDALAAYPPVFRDYTSLGRACDLVGDHAAASAYLRRACELFPGDAELLAMTAESHLRAGDRAAARRYWLRAHERLPGDPRVAELGRQIDAADRQQ